MCINLRYPLANNFETSGSKSSWVWIRLLLTCGTPQWTSSSARQFSSFSTESLTNFTQIPWEFLNIQHAWILQYKSFSLLGEINATQTIWRFYRDLVIPKKPRQALISSSNCLLLLGLSTSHETMRTESLSGQSAPVWVTFLLQLPLSESMEKMAIVHLQRGIK